jgi:hypothetical protein
MNGRFSFMTHRPLFAFFVLPIRFEGTGEEERDAVLLRLSHEDVRSKMQVFDLAARLSVQQIDFAELVIYDSAQFLDLTPQLAGNVSRLMAQHAALPVGDMDPTLLDLEPARSADLHVSRETLYWKVPSKGYHRGFRTGKVYWADMMEWLLLFTPESRFPEVFRRLIERDPERAVAIMESGNCFSRQLAWGKGLRVIMPVEAVELLLSHKDVLVREAAIKALGSGEK